MCPGVCSRPLPGVCRPELGCHPQGVCVPLGLLYLSGKETVNLWGSLGRVRAQTGPCCSSCRSAPQATPMASLEQRCSPGLLLHSAVWLLLSCVLISDCAPSSSLISLCGPALFLLG